MAGNEHDSECGALWYHGDGADRAKHVCHRDRDHRGSHHADSGLSWTRLPHARQVRMTTDPCADCEPIGARR
jgi:hypothetical protein